MTRLTFSEKRTNVQMQFQETGNRLMKELNYFNKASKNLLLRGGNTQRIYLRQISDVYFWVLTGNEIQES